MEGEWVDAVLYTPFNNEQATMDQYAQCLATQAFLRMAGLTFRLEQRPNIEFMSPNGQVPIIRLKSDLVCEYMPIVELVGKKGVKMTGTLTDSEKADLYAHIAMIEEVIRNAEIYLCWNIEKVYQRITRHRYGNTYFWPLNTILPYMKRQEMVNYLDAIGWLDYTTEDVLKKCEKCFHALSIKLGENKYFIGDQPTELDSLAYGHLFTILTMELPYNEVARTLSKYSNLIDFCKRIDHDCFT